MRLSYIHSFLALSLVLSVGGCQDQKGPDGLQKLTEEFSRTVQSAKEQFEKIAPQRQEIEQKAGAETEKLFTFEYRVQEIGKDVKPAEIQARLAALGKDRWDCFHIEPRKDALLLFCKRQPKTYLRYIPRVF